MNIPHDNVLPKVIIPDGLCFKITFPSPYNEMKCEMIRSGNIVPLEIDLISLLRGISDSFIIIDPDMLNRVVTELTEAACSPQQTNHFNVIAIFWPALSDKLGQLDVFLFHLFMDLQMISVDKHVSVSPKWV